MSEPRTDAERELREAIAHVVGGSHQHPDRELTALDYWTADALLASEQFTITAAGARTPTLPAGAEVESFDVWKAMGTTLANMLGGVVDRLRLVDPEMVAQFEFSGEDEYLFEIIDRLAGDRPPAEREES